MEVHYSLHKSQPLHPTLSQTNPIDALTSCLFKIQLNIFYFLIGLC